MQSRTRCSILNNKIGKCQISKKKKTKGHSWKEHSEYEKLKQSGVCNRQPTIYFVNKKLKLQHFCKQSRTTEGATITMITQKNVFWKEAFAKKFSFPHFSLYHLSFQFSNLAYKKHLSIYSSQTQKMLVSVIIKDVSNYYPLRSSYFLIFPIKDFYLIFLETVRLHIKLPFKAYYSLAKILVFNTF